MAMPRAELRILAERDVRAVLDTASALDLARRTLLDQAAGGSFLSSPSSMALDARPAGGPGLKFKAATVGHLQASGVRLLSRPGANGKRTVNYCMVYDHDSSRLAGLVDEPWLCRLRTAAFGTVASQALVNPGPLKVALFGTGGIAREIVPMLARTLEVSAMTVSSRRPESMAAFVAEHAGSVPFGVRAEPDPRRAMEGAGLVLTVTESPTPLVWPGSLAPGAVVCSMGSYNEVDWGVMQQAQRLVVDDADYASEIGDGAAWIAQGHLDRAGLQARIDAYAWEVAAGRKPGRTAPEQRIVALMQGMAIGDVAFAAHALREARARGLGTVVALD